jgi:hypothetical protein
MPKGWRITVEYGLGQKTIVNVGLSDLAQAEAAAINHVGKGEVVIRESLSDAQYEELLAAGKLIGHTSSRSG